MKVQGLEKVLVGTSGKMHRIICIRGFLKYMVLFCFNFECSILHSYLRFITQLRLPFSGGSEGRQGRALPSQSNLFHFHAFFGSNFAK